MTRRLDRFASVARLTLVIGLLFAITHPLAAQPPTGRIVGRIVDAVSGRGIPDAGIQIVGTTMGIMSGFEGRYALGNIPAGTVTLQVRLLGYQPKTVTGLQLSADATLEQDISLSPATVQLEMTVVTADAERGSVNAALNAQRNATGIVSAVTSEQIQKSPDGDAAQAVQRVSGVTVQDGKYVYVRGLGDRYTTASLNGARIPSPESEKRLVPLDLFPAGLLQSVTTSKTFTPDQPGDFSGASVEIQTREFPANRQIAYSATIGYNTAATGKSVLAAPRVGSEWLGFAGAERDVPAALYGWRDVIQLPGGPAANEVVNSLRNAWSARSEDGTPNTSMSVSLGGSDALLGRTIGYVGSLSYSYNQEVRAGELRELSQSAAGGGADAYASFRGSTGRASVQWGGLLNLSTLVGGSSRIALNNTYSRTADNEARFEEGVIEEYEDRRSLLRYIERTVRSNQLLVQHQISARHALDWSVTSSGVTRVEPDRAEATYRRLLSDPAGTPFRLESSRGARRSFFDLDESNISAAANYRVEFGAPGRAHSVKFGGTYRSTSRDSDNLSFGVSSSLPASALELPPEQIFDGRFTGPSDSTFTVSNELRSGSYGADDRVAAGYAMLELALSERVRMVGGARVESGDLDVVTRLVGGQTIPSGINKTDVLPSLAITFRPGESHNLRLSASQTLSRPEYRELSPTLNEDPATGVAFEGNPNLRRTLIQNADARWEWYPNAGEVLSVGVFYKRFEDPIERIELGVSGLREAKQQTVVNAKSARNYGVEVELRKRLGFLARAFDDLVMFTNATVMESEIDIGTESQTNPQRPMVGQAPYVVNAGLTYSTPSGHASTTALYNVVGKRITAAAALPMPDIYEQPRHALDLSIRFPVIGSLSGKLDAKNLLDQPYEILQDDVVRERYRAGRVLSLGLSWRQ
jgi:outer membrane receptor for ferrienterochelin and colicin